MGTWYGIARTLPTHAVCVGTIIRWATATSFNRVCDSAPAGLLSHCSWDRDCPGNVQRQAQINVCFPENIVLFFLINEAWMQVTGHAKKVHILKS